VIAAFWDRSLPVDERRFGEEHFATCDRCQTHLAALARTTGVEHSTGRGSEAWDRRWLLDWRWLAPAATAAIVVLAVWGIEPDSVDQMAPAVRDSDFADRGADNTAQRQEQSRAVPLRQRVDAGPTEQENAPAASAERMALDEAAATGQPSTSESAATSPPRDTIGVAEPPLTPRAELAERRLRSLSLDARGAAASIASERIEADVVGIITTPDRSASWRLTREGGSNARSMVGRPGLRSRRRPGFR